MTLTIRVHGLPAPQGSKRHVGNGVMVESSKAVKPWREAVKWAALDVTAVAIHDWKPLSGPLRVVASFTFVRPRSHYGTGRNANRVKDSAPWYPAGKPDIDKLVRSSFDALTDAGIWKDDAQVVRLETEKNYAETAGATFVVAALLSTGNPGPTTNPVPQVTVTIEPVTT